MDKLLGACTLPIDIENQHNWKELNLPNDLCVSIDLETLIVAGRASSQSVQFRSIN